MCHGSPGVAPLAHRAAVDINIHAGGQVVNGGRGTTTAGTAALDVTLADGLPLPEVSAKAPNPTWDAPALAAFLRTVERAPPGDDDDDVHRRGRRDDS